MRIPINFNDELQDWCKKICDIYSYAKLASKLEATYLVAF